jgi:ribosomal protein S18 acetylase RimI-like enzyme
MPIIRKAGRNDALQLAQVAERTFRETFGVRNTAEDMDLHCQLNYGETIQMREIAAPNLTTFLAEEEDRLVGYAQVRWDGAPNCVLAKSPGELQRLYVVTDWHGKGIAQGLMDACIAEMKGHGTDVVWLGVWERNPRAISFYKKYGFVEVGDRVFPLGSDPQRDIVMARSVVGYRTST